MSAPQGVVVLGSTGSIGRQTLEVVRHLGGSHRVVGLTAHRRAADLLEQIREFRPLLAALADEREAASIAAPAAAVGTRLLAGPEGVEAVAAAAGGDIVVAGIVGAAGLRPTLAAVTAGRRVALANKEALVVAGAVMRAAAEASGAELLPVDSEHNALHQCLRGGRAGEVRRLILTASGGPFRTRDRATFEAITVEEALAHPVWDMGPKISVDSATLMNKGLEVIEARWLFDVPPERIEILVHPGSVVHSFVEFVDGSVLAQLGVPDMRLPIQYALTWPERRPSPVAALDLTALPPLRFEPPDLERFPCAALARRALTYGPLAPAALNGANEAAVAAFLERRLPFTGIARMVGAVLDALAEGIGPTGGDRPDLEDCLAADRFGRDRVLAGLAAPAAAAGGAR